MKYQYIFKLCEGTTTTRRRPKFREVVVEKSTMALHALLFFASFSRLPQGILKDKN